MKIIRKQQGMPGGSVGIYRPHRLGCWLLLWAAWFCKVPAGHRKTVEKTKTDKGTAAISRNLADTCRTCPIWLAIVLITVALYLVFMTRLACWCKGWCKVP